MKTIDLGVKNITVLVSLLFISFQLNAQDIMMQGWYWDYPKPVPCGTAPTSWANNISAKAATLGNACFTYVWLPPPTRASFGSCSNGYDPQDIYDLGEYGQGPTGYGTRAELDGSIAALNGAGIKAIADVVFNHRDGGDWEDNPGVQSYLLDPTICNPGSKTPYPVNGKARYVLPLGGSSSNGAGDYYIKWASLSGNSGFNGATYKLYMQTSLVGFQGSPAQTEMEPNGGGDCGEPSNTMSLGVDMNAVEEIGSCNTDEFLIQLTASDFNAAGDLLEIYIEEVGGGGSGIDIRPYGIYYTGTMSDIISDLKAQTKTDFSAMPSGQGSMNYTNFKPNGTDATCLLGDIDFPLFFFDVEENTSVPVYSAWADWLLGTVGFDGLRMDAVKHMETSFVSSIVSSLSSAPSLVVGEFFDTNAGVLKGWSDASGSRVFDFALRQSLKDACDAFGYDVRNVFNSGIVDGAGGSGFQTVTFINNHDYRKAGEPIQNDAMLAYAYILTNNQVGLPCVFYPDFFGDPIPNAPVNNLQAEISELNGILKNYIHNSNSIDKLNRIGSPYSANYLNSANGATEQTSLIYQLSGGVGGKEVIVAINFSGATLQVDHGINMTNISVGDEISELTSNSNFPSTIVNAIGQMYIDLPPRSYGVWINCPAATAPLDLLTFDVEKTKEGALLTWETANEINVDQMIIERSIDGKQFEAVGSLPAINSLEGNEYSFLDYSANDLSGEVFYRLNIVDFDGSQEYSEIRSIRLDDGQLRISFYPNPTHNELFFEHLVDDKSIVIFYDQQGKHAYTCRLSAKIDISILTKGIYFMEIRNAERQLISSNKIVKLE